MPCWRIRPAADRDDPRWLDHPIWSEIIVRAKSAAEARLVAGTLQADPDAPPAGNEWPSHRSAFDDEKLYWVEEVSAPVDGVDQAPGDAAVLRARR